MAIVQLREVMGIKAVAEFVEDQDIFEELIKIGIDYAQGYHVGGLLVAQCQAVLNLPALKQKPPAPA